MDASCNEMDVNMFNQYMYKSNEANLNVSLSVQGQQQQFSGQLHQSNQFIGTMNDHTFHTPSFGDEEFDIPDVMHHSTQAQHNQLDQFQLHGGMMNNQQQATPQSYSYSQQHQWTQAAAQQPQTELTYQNHSDYHHHITNSSENILMMPPQQQSSINNAATNNYLETPSSVPINNHENGSNSDDSDDNALNDPNNTFKPFEEDTIDKGEESVKKAVAVKTVAAKGKKKKKDPNEPLKPVSAYALFFRDTQAAIKGQNPNASFGEVSKIVASMWDVLAPEHKNVYKKKQETAKKEYLKALSAYRAGNLQTPDNNTGVSRDHQTVTSQPIQNFAPQIQTMTAPTFPQNFVSQPIINQAVIQQPPAQQQQQQAPINQFENNQQMQQQQQQIYQQPLQSITNNNNNQMPPVATQPAQQNYEKCIRNGCLNPAIVSVDWEDEYCSNECVILHCREVFGNFIQMNSSNQQINFPVK